MNRLFRPVDISSLAALRFIFGSLMVVAMTRYFANGWIDAMYVEPQFFFNYQGFAWVQPWPGIGMYLHYAALIGLALGIAIGFAYRASIALFLVGFTYAHLIDKTNYLNHYYLLSLIAFLLMFMPLGRAWSLAVYRKPSWRLDFVPQWMVWVVRFQLAVVYVFAGIAKLDADWLVQAQPLRLWLGTQGEVPILGPLLVSTWAPYLFSWAGVAFDLGIVPFLLWRRTRLSAYACVVIFHLATSLLFPIGLFPWVMIGLTTIFFEPDWPRRFLRRVQTVRRPVANLDWHAQLNSIQCYTVVAFLAMYAALQIAVPLRFLGRAGAINWTEDGFRFAWRVMLIEKYGHAAFELHDVRTGETESIDPKVLLSPMQVRMMSTQPDMVLQFAHWLSERERQHGRDVEVRARVEVSLNGRPHEPLVDPNLNLAKVPLSTAASEWTLPFGGTIASTQLAARRPRR